MKIIEEWKNEGKPTNFHPNRLLHVTQFMSAATTMSWLRAATSVDGPPITTFFLHTHIFNSHSQVKIKKKKKGKCVESK